MDEILRKLTAQVMSTAFIADDNVVVVPTVKLHRLAKLALARLTPGQIALLVELLEGEKALVPGYAIGGTSSGVGWTVQGTYAGAERHTVLDDLSACSCKDNQMRGRECRHIVLLRRFLS